MFQNVHQKERTRISASPLHETYHLIFTHIYLAKLWKKQGLPWTLSTGPSTFCVLGS